MGGEFQMEAILVLKVGLRTVGGAPHILPNQNHSWIRNFTTGKNICFRATKTLHQPKPLRVMFECTRITNQIRISNVGMGLGLLPSCMDRRKKDSCIMILLISTYHFLFVGFEDLSQGIITLREGLHPSHQLNLTPLFLTSF